MPLPISIDWDQILSTASKSLGFSEADKFIQEEEEMDEVPMDEPMEPVMEPPTEPPMDMPIDEDVPMEQPIEQPIEEPGMMQRLMNVFRR